MLYIRQGQILDSHTYFPKQIGASTAGEILRGFISQFYLERENKRDYPQVIMLSEPIEDQDLLENVISETIQKKVTITTPQRGAKLQWIAMAKNNALQALLRRANQTNNSNKRWIELKKELGIANGLTRIECFDISHTQGEATTASCVVFDMNGPVKAEYRTYQLDVGNNDYEAMEQVLTRRYTKRKANELTMPEVILIDGGKGQLHRARKAILECQMLDVVLIGIAKGEGRKPGLETLYVCRSNDNEESIIGLSPTSPAFHLLQHIRDESHRFAIRGHRKKRSQTRKRSSLETIPGVGKKRSQLLLNHFGGLQGLQAASVQAIANVPGIGERLAEEIYQALHD
jgi:excinuclease ABC subunit C